MTSTLPFRDELRPQFVEAKLSAYRPPALRNGQAKRRVRKASGLRMPIRPLPTGRLPGRLRGLAPGSPAAMKSTALHVASRHALWTVERRLRSVVRGGYPDLIRSRSHTQGDSLCTNDTGFGGFCVLCMINDRVDAAFIAGRQDMLDQIERTDEARDGVPSVEDYLEANLPKRPSLARVIDAVYEWLGSAAGSASRRSAL